MAISSITYKGFDVVVRARESTDKVRWHIEISIKSDSVSFMYLISEPYLYSQETWLKYITNASAALSHQSSDPSGQLRRECNEYVFEYTDHHSSRREFRFNAAPINRLLREIIEKASLMGYFSD